MSSSFFTRGDDKLAVDGQPLVKPCGNTHHGIRTGTWPIGVIFTPDQYDSECGTCQARYTLQVVHDHLHLAPPFECVTQGITGTPGQMVKCKCGAFHH